ncbi:SdpI family protein [Candidatus Uhrbacteria bacterium]|nr:SdpI family protein [Candidatus Uhrbacteria bacterium]
MKLPFNIYRPVEAITVGIVSATVLASPFFYRLFPDRVPTHWNASGAADGWSGPAFAAFFFPAIIVAIYLLMLVLPSADPQKDRYREFSRPYQILRLATVSYMAAIYAVTSLIGLGFDIPIAKASMAGIGLLFLTIGNFMPKFRKNWFVGIRTPWTLSSETVWNRTHRVGGKLFTLGGLAALLSMLLPPRPAFAVFTATVLGLTFGTIGYSWWVWRGRKGADR